MPADYPAEAISGLVLAGGLARRMGGIDKGLVVLAGKPMIEHVLAGLAPQVGRVLINANRNLEQYGGYGYEVVSDTLEGYLGPLAGALSALEVIDTEFLLTVPCDSPLVAPDLAGRMYAALRLGQADLAVAHDGRRQQPVFLLLKRGLAADLEAYLASGERKIDRWFARHRVAEADLSDRPDSFINVNEPEEKQRLEALILSKPPAA
ncbi:MAG TPA: molybdenum cofactor guanylyltransferase MobA [Steroidobacteraceae bacterium]|nr:molybdenum cofactor guanylyltransferase MobA [Steroidobacteraceae bacterium]